MRYQGEFGMERAGIGGKGGATMKLTQKQMIEAVNNARMDDECKQKLIDGIKINSMIACHAAYGLHARQTGAADAAIERYRNRC